MSSFSLSHTETDFAVRFAQLLTWAAGGRLPPSQHRPQHHVLAGNQEQQQGLGE